MQPERQTVLVVDDDVAICEVVRDMLETTGCAVGIAHDGLSALARIEVGGVDLVLLDLMIPGVDGREVCRQVRARRRALYLPIIMVTALGRADERHAGFAAGADDYITKPFVMDDLIDRAQVWLRMRQRLQVAAAQRYADTEAALQLARTPLQALLNLMQVLQSSTPSAESVADVRAQLAESALAVDAQMSDLRRLLREAQ